MYILDHITVFQYIYLVNNHYLVNQFYIFVLFTSKIILLIRVLVLKELIIVFEIIIINFIENTISIICVISQQWMYSYAYVNLVKLIMLTRLNVTCLIIGIIIIINITVNL